MAKHVYISCEENGRAGAERVADMYRSANTRVTIEHGEIPEWGSAIPTSSTYGMTRPGYRIIVEDDKPEYKPIIR